MAVEEKPTPVKRENGKTFCPCCGTRLKITGTNNKHGMYGDPAYRSWSAMKSRCLNKKSYAYKMYGGRGISICERWINSFQNFFDDMGPRPEKMSLDRINNDGNYEPGNCRWANALTQNSNTRVSRKIGIKGKIYTLHGAARIAGIHFASMSQRIKKGLNDTELLLPKFHFRSGSHHHRCVISPEIVSNVLAASRKFKSNHGRKTYGRTIYLSNKFGITKSTIKHILAGKTWVQK